jgi:anti-sigma B factor antagonist
VVDAAGSVSAVTESPGPGPATEQLMTVQRDEDDRTVVVTVTGEIDILTAPRLHDALTAALHEAAGRAVVVDLTAVELLSSAGLSAMSRARRLAEVIDEPLRLVIDHARPVIRPLQITGMEHDFELHHTLGEALRSR